MFKALDHWFEAARFGADVQQVMTLRIMRIASGGSNAATEAQQMVAEKLAAFRVAQAEKVRAIADVRGEVADLALLAAGRVVGESMTDERQRRLVDEFLSSSAIGDARN